MNYYTKRMKYLFFPKTEKKINYLKKKKVIEDFYNAVYLLITSCASFNEFYSKNKIHIENKIESLQIKIQNYPSSFISCDFLFSCISELIVGINDLHSCIFQTNSKNIRVFGNKSTLIFSNEYFDKTDDNCFISCNSNVKFKAFSITKKTKFNEQYAYSIPVLLNNHRMYKIAYLYNSLVLSNALQYQKENFNPDNIYIYSKRLKDADYWLFPDSRYEDYEKKMDEIISASKKSKKNIKILDCRFNTGGNPHKIYELIFTILGTLKYFNIENSKSINEKGILDGKVILSSSVAQNNIIFLEKMNSNDEDIAKIKDYWKDIYDNYNNGEYSWYSDNYVPEWISNQNFKNDIKYNGYFIVAISNNTASCGELVYSILAQKLRISKVILIGTNSSGCVSYGNVFWYMLKNSRIQLRLSSSTNPLGNKIANTQKEFVECRGYIPDYWCTNEKEYYETLKTLIKKLKK